MYVFGHGVFSLFYLWSKMFVVYFVEWKCLLFYFWNNILCNRLFHFLLGEMRNFHFGKCGRWILIKNSFLFVFLWKMLTLKTVCLFFTLMEIRVMYQFQSLDYPNSVQLSLCHTAHVRWCNHSLVIQSTVRNFRCYFLHDVRLLHTNGPLLRDVFPCIRKFLHKLELLISVQFFFSKLAYGTEKENRKTKLQWKSRKMKLSLALFFIWNMKFRWRHR